MSTPRKPAPPKKIETEPELRRNQLLEEIRDALENIALNLSRINTELMYMKNKMK